MPYNMQIILIVERQSRVQYQVMVGGRRGQVVTWLVPL